MLAGAALLASSSAGPPFYFPAQPIPALPCPANPHRRRVFVHPRHEPHGGEPPCGLLQERCGHQVGPLGIRRTAAQTSLLLEVCRESTTHPLASAEQRTLRPSYRATLCWPSACSCHSYDEIEPAVTCGVCRELVRTLQLIAPPALPWFLGLASSWAGGRAPFATCCLGSRMGHPTHQLPLLKAKAPRVLW